MTEERKLKIFNTILSLGNIWGEEKTIDRVEILNHIWDLNLLSSDDPRYKDAYGDAIQHLRNNNDWDEKYVFLTRFGLLKGNDNLFFKFLAIIVSPIVRGSKDEILRYVNQINELLKDSKVKLVKIGTEKGLPIYEVDKDVTSLELPSDVNKNAIPFYVDSIPEQYPSLFLASSSWDDYGRRTSFELKFYQTKGSYYSIGKVKIMHSEELVTLNTIPSYFNNLLGDFCSVGQSINYYYNIKQLFPNKYKDVLFALRDAAYYTIIADQYQYTISFDKSLIRDNDAGITFRKARSILDGIEDNNKYHFTILSQIPYYDENTIPVKFDFGNLNSHSNLDRIKALIGENGSGKTSILYSIAKALNDNKKDMFEKEHKPDFSKVVAISYSIFDNFYKLTKNSSFNFVYCGLRDKEENLISKKDIAQRFALSLDNINYKNRTNNYYETLSEVVEKDILKNIIDDKEKICKNKFEEIKAKMSSGQQMIVSIITELYAHIRENALILFDEPEVHLHANAITKLVNILFEICEEFNSACIIATHSSVIIQELLARNVSVVERDNNSNEPMVRPMNTETLGENLTTITEDVFGRAEISKHYRQLVNKYVDKGNNNKDIENLLKTEGLPMSLNLYMYIRQQFALKNKND